MRPVLFTLELAILASLLSDEILVEDDVLVLNAVNFEEVVRSTVYIFVAFYSKGGKPLSPEFTRVATTLYREESVIELGKLEVTQAQEIAEIYGVRKFPSYLLFRDERIFFYLGELKADFMIYWLKKKTSPPEFVDIQSPQQLKNLVATEPRTLIGFFPDRETRKARAFMEDSTRNDHVMYAVVSDPTLIWMVGGTDDQVVAFGQKSVVSLLTPAIDKSFDNNEDYEDPPDINERVITEFPFLLPNNLDDGEFFNDNTVPREVLRIEHNERTSLEYVGLQVWVCSLLLADLLVYLGLQGELTGKTVLEIGGGTGITSIVASMFAKKVICTDYDDDILFKVKKLNFEHNSRVIKGRIVSVAMDLTKPWTTRVARLVQEVDVVIASDVVYDAEVTKGLIATLSELLRRRPRAVLYFALEERFVSDFTDRLLETFISSLQAAASERGACVLAAEELHHETIPRFFFKYERITEIAQFKMYCK